MKEQAVIAFNLCNSVAITLATTSLLLPNNYMISSSYFFAISGVFWGVEKLTLFDLSSFTMVIMPIGLLLICIHARLTMKTGILKDCNIIRNALLAVFCFYQDAC